MSDISWQDCTVTLGELQPWEDNPKTSTKKDAKSLLRSFDELGQFQTVAIGPSGEVYDGHQRLSALLVVYGKDHTIDARRSSRPLTEIERKKVAIYSRQIGAWDWDKLASWQPADLMEWGFDQATLKDWKRDTAALSNFLKSEISDDKYTKKILSPHYEPSDTPPCINDLFDVSVTTNLLQDIETAQISEDEKFFLRLAAQRHTVLSFDRIADYYAQASPEMQRLMEDSALVIIDFQKAIERGFVELSDNLINLVREQYGE